MVIDLHQAILDLSKSFDRVDCRVFGDLSNHGERVAVLGYAIGAQLGLPKTILFELMSISLLHDTAMANYLYDERSHHSGNISLLHASETKSGQALPLRAKVDQLIQYHRETQANYDPFKRYAGKIPLEVEIVSFSDYLDEKHPLHLVPEAEFPVFKEKAFREISTLYSSAVSAAFRQVLTVDLLASIRDERIHDTVAKTLPACNRMVSQTEIVQVMAFVAHIIDYKSVFTRKHTTQIANRVWLMCDFYKIDLETKMKLYLAASFHDIGKMYIPIDILEKPGKLLEDEFATIKKHVWYTRELVKGIRGFEDACSWAYNHHEKLDGSGYPFGKTQADLDFPSRLLACVDIYQAVSEERPYHSGRGHNETMAVLADMAKQGMIDRSIVDNLGRVMLPYSLKDVPGVYTADEEQQTENVCTA